MAELTYPNRVNTQGMPTLSGTPRIETIGSTATLVIEFNPHLALNDNWSGAFWVSINGTIAAGQQPVVFATSGVTGTTALTRYSGGQVTASEILTNSNGGVLLCFYNNDAKRLQLIALI